MAVTIQQIAERAGVSRGTVDRALNHRGRINPEVAEKICRLADEMGYVQKERKRSRTAKDERLKIGVVTQLARSSFMQEVNRGIEKASQELKEKGIQLILKKAFPLMRTNSFRPLKNWNRKESVALRRCRWTVRLSGRN